LGCRHADDHKIDGLYADELTVPRSGALNARLCGV
jgi:hypothetical protein